MAAGRQTLTGGQADQFLGEQRSGFIGEAKGGTVGNFFELPADGGVDFRMIMAVQIGPDGGIGIEIFLAVNIFQPGTLAGLNEDGFVFEPVAHLGKRMPDVGLIELGEGMRHVSPEILKQRREIERPRGNAAR